MPHKPAPKRKTTRSKAARAKRGGSTLGSSVIHRKLKLSQHKHTFKRLPTQHTSRGVLVILSLVTGFLLLYVTKSYTANVDALTGSGSLGLSGLVRPTTAATLDKPVNKQIFNTKEITVSGTCPTSPPNNIVKIIDNGIVGITTCNDGLYQLKIDLFPGVNFLRSRISDIYNHDGPDSTVIRVYYSLAGGGSGSSAAPFNISASSSSFSTAIDKPFSLVISVTGGKEPYAFSVNWGDGSNDVVSRADDNAMTVEHRYHSATQYEIMVNASDSAGQKAFAQSPVLVSGPLVVGGSAGQNSNSSTYGASTLKKLVPVYVITTSAVVVFWLGEVFEHSRLINLTKFHAPRR